jgi:transposase
VTGPFPATLVTVTRTAQRWFVSSTAEVERAVPYRHDRPWSAVGIDLGVKTLLVGTDNLGNVFSVPGPRPLGTALRKLRRASRACSRKEPGSANRRKSATRLARIHARATCSGCGTVKAKLPLSQRTYTCQACGLVIDRDINAARNLLQFAASGAESLNACGGTIRPRPARHVPVKQEPGTAHTGRAGTVPKATRGRDMTTPHGG